MKNKAIIVLVAALLCACSPKPTEPVATQSSGVVTVTTSSPEARAHLEKGEALLENLRVADGIQEIDQALKADPNFTLAHAYHGIATPGPQGLEELQDAEAAAGSLPEAERALIQGFAATRSGEGAKAREAFTRVTQLAPGDYRGHLGLGQQLLGEQKYADATQALKKAVELNAQSGGAQNMLGYASLRQQDTAGAIAAFEQYARILPQEPNAQDSLGEALMAAGRFADAEAAFQKALQLSPQFWNAHQGIAYTKIYAGDWTGGRAALMTAKDAARLPSEKLSVDNELAAVTAAQRNTAEALRMFDAQDKASAEPSDVAFVPVSRAYVLIDAGRPREALAPIAVALKNAASGTLPPGNARNVRREALRARIIAETDLGDATAAKQTSMALDQDASARPDDTNAQSAMQYGRAMLAAVSGDKAGMQAAFDRCSREDDLCLWQNVRMAEKIGDSSGATAARERLLKVYKRDPLHLIARTRVTAAKKTT
jgi:tetratricopeptide (TPR) repeat protein